MPVVSSTNLINRPGDLVIEDVILSTPSGMSVSIWNLIMSVQIYEDIYSNFLSGTITFSDSLALNNHLPIQGNELLKIVFYTPGQKDQPHNKVELNMRVFKNRKISGTDKSVMVILSFISEEFFINNMVKFSQAYTNMSYSDMAEKIFNQYILEPVKEIRNKFSGLPRLPEGIANYNTFFNSIPTEGSKKSVVFPFWSPFYAINWLANRSFTTIASGKRAADYLFFQQLSGQYMFAPISYFKSLPATAKYRQVPADKAKEDLMFDNAKEITISTMNDKLIDITSGVFSSVLTTLDINKKKIGADLYKYREKFMTTQHTDTYPLVPSAIDMYSDNNLSYMKILPKNSNKFDNVEDVEEYEKFSLIRQSSMNQMNTLMIEMKVHGDSRRRVGDMVYVDITSPEDIDSRYGPKGDRGDGSDRYLSGNYMITKINHTFTHNDYELVMQLSKDSYRAPVPDQKEPLKVLPTQ